VPTSHSIQGNSAKKIIISGLSVQRVSRSNSGPLKKSGKLFSAEQKICIRLFKTKIPELFNLRVILKKPFPETIPLKTDLAVLYAGAAAASAGLPAGERQEEAGHGHRQPKHFASILSPCQIIIKGTKAWQF
jgi:hypothetical protein